VTGRADAHAHPAAAEVAALDARLGELLAGSPPIVCFANDWTGDPTSKHHIMRNFSRHVPVIWVEASGMRRPDLGNVADLRRIAARLRRALVRTPSDAPAGPAARPADDAVGGAGPVRVISPLGVPLPGNRAAEWVNARLYRRAVARALGGAGALPDVWVYTPTVAPYLDAIPHRRLVYHCVDRWWAFSEYDGEVMRRCHASLCARADVVFASAGELLQDCLPHAPHAQLMTHGVDWAHFSRAAFDPPPRPGDIADITGPIVGFFGLLHDWIDQDLLGATADRTPDATLVLIGKAPVDISRLTARPNVRWLGQKKFAELPAYAAAFDVALVPFVRNELTAAVNPIKLHEYLSAGVPVVATPLPEITRIPPQPGLVLADSTDDFVAAVQALLARPWSADQRRAAADAQSPHSWLARCVRIAELLAARR
jgi:glycosyltransferase involved in cell wall biosynthesis